jgi:GR25 family glycosyltransferase involved in LPS biosynthesis
MVLASSVIHLERAVERLPIIEGIKRIFPELEVFPANDGSKWMADPEIKKAHPWTKIPVTQGSIGCTYTHIEIIKRAIERKEKYTLIFEDDCHFNPEVTTEAVEKFIEAATEWDILLLGGTEYVESSQLTPEFKRVGRFWGAHGLIINQRACHAALKGFEKSQAAGDFLPGDWLYNEAIKVGGLTCIGPSDPFLFCKQKEGLLSNLTGKIRKYQS